jgi:photosystem II stability/assembly factor-like uncharacterized protein
MTKQDQRIFSRLLLLAALPMICLARGASSDPEWSSTGPAPPAVEAAIVSDPDTGTMLVGGTGGGILRSTNGGRTFAWSNEGLTSLTIFSLLMDHTAPATVYAGTISGIHKSTNGGLTWQNLPGSSLGAVVMVMDPSNHDTLYAGNSPNGGVTRSLDGGATWTALNNGLGSPAVFALAIDPRNPQVLYMGTAGAGAWKTVNGGQSWSPLTIDTSVWSMLVDPEDSSVVYAGTNGSGVYRSDDGGGSFHRVGSPDNGVVYALAKAAGRLYAGTGNGGASVSLDGGHSWRNTGAADSQGLALSVDARGTVFLGTSFDGALALRDKESASADAGPDDSGDLRREGHWHRLAWRQLRNCTCQNGHAITVDPGDSRHVMLSTNDGGLLETRDGGHSWQDAGVRGMTARGPRGIAFDPVDPRHVYVGGFTGMGFFRSTDNGRTWERRLFGSPLMYTTGVTVDPADRSVYVMTLSAEGVWKSRDFGETFERVDRAAGAPAGTFLNLSGRGITADPHRPGVIYAAASRGASAGIWRSVDAGATWQRVNTSQALSVTVDPGNAQIVYAAGPGPSALKSTNGGTSFVAMNTGLPAGFQTPRTGSVQVNSLNPSEVWVGLEGAGIYRSLDGAQSWQPADTGLADPNVYGLTMDPDDPAVLYAATAASVFSTRRRGRQ